jgi:RNA recognition motif-containing protein
MNIYVGYLPDTFTEEQLKEKFSQYGKVSSVKIITDRDTKLSKGFGFVEMKDNYEGQLAIDGLLTWEIDGKRIKVNVARERERDNNFNSRFNDRDNKRPNPNFSKKW